MKIVKKIIQSTLLTALAILMLIPNSMVANAQQSLNNRSLKISNSSPSASNVNYSFSFTASSAGLTIGSVYVQFCQNSPIVNDTCTPVPGIDASGSFINSQTGISNFSILNSTQNSITFSRPPAFIPGSTNISIGVGGVNNPNINGTFYGRIQLFSTANATGAASYEGGMTASIDNPVNLSTWVPPWLFICVGVSIPGYACSSNINSYIDLGELSSRYSRYSSSEVLIATNATSGYSLYVTGNTLTSGVNTIKAIATPTSSLVGTSQFGINLKDNSNPNVGANLIGVGSGGVSASYNISDRFMFQSGDFLASSNDTTLGEKYTVSYLVNVDSQQKPGIYTTTLVYVVTATF